MDQWFTLSVSVRAPFDGSIKVRFDGFERQADGSFTLWTPQWDTATIAAADDMVRKIAPDAVIVSADRVRRYVVRGENAG